MTEAQLVELDGYLVDKSYITGYTITQDDVYEFSRVKSVPAGLVNLARWHRHIASYSDDFSTIPGEKRAPPQAWDLINMSSLWTVRRIRQTGNLRLSTRTQFKAVQQSL